MELKELTSELISFLEETGTYEDFLCFGISRGYECVDLVESIGKFE